MGSGTLTSRSDNDLIPASDHNELVEALRIDFVPRNNSNAAEDIIGSLGTSAYRWLRGYITELRVGAAANNLRIYEGATGEIYIENGNNDRIKITDGAVELWTNGVKRFDVTDSGINWATLPSGNIPTIKIEDKPAFNFGPSTAASPALATLFTQNLTVKNNKKYLFTVYMNALSSIGGGAGEVYDYEMAIDTTIVREAHYDDTPNASIPAATSLVYTYIATSDVSKTFSFKYRGQIGGAEMSITEI